MSAPGGHAAAHAQCHVREPAPAGQRRRAADQRLPRIPACGQSHGVRGAVAKLHARIRRGQGAADGRDHGVGDEAGEGVFRRAEQFLHVLPRQQVPQRSRRFHVREFLGRDEDDAPLWVQDLQRPLPEQQVQIEPAAGRTEPLPIQGALIRAQRLDRHVGRITDDAVEGADVLGQEVAFEKRDGRLAGESAPRLPQLRRVPVGPVLSGCGAESSPARR